MKTRLLICLSLPLFLTGVVSGCKKKADAQPPAAQAVAPGDQKTEAVLAQLTQQLRRYGQERKTVPQTFEEFAASGYLKEKPVPPSGKKFAIAVRQMEIVLVDQ